MHSGTRPYYSQFRLIIAEPILFITLFRRGAPLRRCRHRAIIIIVFVQTLIEFFCSVVSLILKSTTHRLRVFKLTPEKWCASLSICTIFFFIFFFFVLFKVFLFFRFSSRTRPFCALCVVKCIFYWYHLSLSYRLEEI